MRKLALVAAMAGAVLGAPAAASALWAASATGSGRLDADTMTNASAFTVVCASGQRNSAMNLSWTPSPDPYVTGYEIVRTNSVGVVVMLPTVVGRTTEAATDTPANKDNRPVTYSFTIRALSSMTPWTTAPTPAARTITYLSNSCT